MHAISVLLQSRNSVVIDLWFKIFPRCETYTVIRTNSSVLHPPFSPFRTRFFTVRLSFSRSPPPCLSSFRERSSHPTDKTSSFAPFLTPSPIPCHLYTIFLVIANIHLRRAPSISRYPNPRTHPCTLHPTPPSYQRRAPFFGLHSLYRSQTSFAIDLRRLFARSRRAR